MGPDNREPTVESLAWRLRAAEEKIRHFEELRLDVMAERLATLSKKADALTKVLWVVAGTFVTAAVTSIFALVIRVH